MEGIKNGAFEGENGIDQTEPKNHKDDIPKSERTELSIAEGIELDSQKPNNNTFSDKLSNYVQSHKRQIHQFKIALLNIIFGAYFAWATYHFIDLKNHQYDFDWQNVPSESLNPNKGERCQGYCGLQWCDGYGMLLILTVFVYIGLLYYQIIKPQYGRRIYKSSLKPTQAFLLKLFKNRLVVLLLLTGVIAVLAIYLYFDTQGSRERLRSLLGMFILLGLGFVFSKHIKKIQYRPVLCGITMQFLLGIFCIRMEVGRNIFGCLGDKTAFFLNYTIHGSSFVFGDLLVRQEGVFAFSVLPVIFFFSFIISILYYWGAMQWTVRKLGWILQSILGTTVCESVTAAGNIFLGMTESPLLIRPYVKYLTASELHAIMASGFATVSGTVLAAYIRYGAEPAHLITSSVMAAPAVLAYSKLFYPETEKSKTTAENIAIEKSTDTSVLDAASNGAITAIGLILGIIANLVAFVSFIAFLNGIVNWFGYLVGFEDLSFEWLFAKLFIPLAYIIGIPWEDCEHVASVIAAKTIINEFVAYERLGKLKLAGLISLRSSAIATFAVCGFANPSSLGIMIGALSSMSPEKKGVIASVAIRAFITGSFVCFINASIAGLLMTEDIFNGMGDVSNSTYLP